MRGTRRGSAPRPANEEMSMQRVMEMMRGLQDEMAESRMEQECMQADLTASHARNEELHRINEELRRGSGNNQGQREQDETERHTLLAGDSGSSDTQHVRRAQSKDSWCEFHEVLGHHINNFLSLGYQLDELVRSGFLKDYVAEPATTATLPAPVEEQAHEMPVLGEVHTIAGGFSGGGPTASQRKKYARGVNSIEERISGDP